MWSSKASFCASNRKHHACVVNPLVYVFAFVNFVLLIKLLSLHVTCTADLTDDMYCAVQLCIALPVS